MKSDFTWFERFLIRLGYKSRCCAAKILPANLLYWPYAGRCSKCRKWL